MPSILKYEKYSIDMLRKKVWYIYLLYFFEQLETYMHHFLYSAYFGYQGE